MMKLPPKEKANLMLFRARMNKDTTTINILELELPFITKGLDVWKVN